MPIVGMGWHGEELDMLGLLPGFGLLAIGARVHWELVEFI
jgi:hypothetical protein